MYNSLSRTKIKCKVCGKEFECGYAAGMHVLCDKCKEIRPKKGNPIVFRYPRGTRRNISSEETKNEM